MNQPTTNQPGTSLRSSSPNKPSVKNRLNDDETLVMQRIDVVRKRAPRLTDEFVTLAHGAGGKASAALVDAVFRTAFSNVSLDAAGDAGVVTLPGTRIAMSTDSYVVNPIEFPGGSIGHLAVHGTLNDLAVSGAIPHSLSAAFVIEEGLPVATLQRIAHDMATAAAAAGVNIITGDTKVVPKGAADKVFITTAGIGHVPDGRNLDPQRIEHGDVLLTSGTLGDHGMAVMMARGDLAIEANIESDTASVSGLIAALYEAGIDVKWMRDTTRGGLGTTCNELAHATGYSIVLDEAALPVKPMVRGACDMLGIDPIYVANEGKFVAVVPAAQSAAALETLRALPFGSEACAIGTIDTSLDQIVVVKTPFGGTRIVDMLVGDPLPRIC